MQTDSRPVLLGMNNPYSERPDTALLPMPRNSAGWRLWKMVHDVCGMSRAEYCRVYDRRNALNERTWRPQKVDRDALVSALAGRTVVVFGAAVWAVLWLPSRPPPLLWHVSRGVRWCWAPHPSGLTREYNDELMRLAVGYRLEELARCRG